MTLQPFASDDNIDHTILRRVYVRENLSCQSPMEVAYYGLGLWVDVCCQCGVESQAQNPITREEGKYPLCANCKNIGKQPLNKRRQSQPRGRQVRPRRE